MPIAGTDRFNAAHEAEEPLAVWNEFRVGNLTRSHRDVLIVLTTYHPKPDEPPQPPAAAVAPSATSKRSAEPFLLNVTLGWFRERHGPVIGRASMVRSVRGICRTSAFQRRLIA